MELDFRMRIPGNDGPLASASAQCPAPLLPMEDPAELLFQCRDRLLCRFLDRILE